MGTKSATKPARRTKNPVQHPPHQSKPHTHAVAAAAAPLALITGSPRGTPFERRVWRLLCQIPRGSVSSYGAVARALGSSARAVGGAVRRNPFAPAVPCHRVVGAAGAIGGYKGEGGGGAEPAGGRVAEKRVLLRREGVRFDGKGRVVGSVFEGFRVEESLDGTEV